MKNSGLKNIISIYLLFTFICSGVITPAVYCESEDCCETSCDEKYPADINNSDLNLILSNKSCCEVNQAAAIEKKAVIYSNKGQSNAFIYCSYFHFSYTNNSNYYLNITSANPILQRNSMSILRI